MCHYCGGRQEFCHVYVAKIWDLTAKMYTQALLSPKLARSHYCYESPGQEVLPNKRLVPLPDRFPIWSDLEVSALLPSPQGTLPLSPLLSPT